MGISAKELAKHINVSAATVSMVLNNKPGISPATRELVLNAAREYGYVSKKASAQPAQPSVIQLVIYKKHGHVVSNTPFFSELTDGITQACNKRSCALHVTYVDEAADMKEQIASINHVDHMGILLLATEMNEEDFKWFAGVSTPIVVLDCYYDSLNYDCVLINNIQGAFNATDYLIECGHRKVGYLRSSVPISNFNERADGYFRALRAHGIDTSHPYVHAISPTSQKGYEDMVSILKGGPKLAEAYFADNDIIAAAAMKAFREFGYRMPEDISIIGFDDMPLCDMMVPSLSTMKVQKDELGTAAVNRLVHRVANPTQSNYKISLSTRLIRRESVQPLS